MARNVLPDPSGSQFGQKHAKCANYGGSDTKKVSSGPPMVENGQMVQDCTNFGPIDTRKVQMTDSTAKEIILGVVCENASAADPTLLVRAPCQICGGILCETPMACVHCASPPPLGDEACAHVTRQDGEVNILTPSLAQSMFALKCANWARERVKMRHLGENNSQMGRARGKLDQNNGKTNSDLGFEHPGPKMMNFTGPNGLFGNSGTLLSPRGVQSVGPPKIGSSVENLDMGAYVCHPSLLTRQFGDLVDSFGSPWVPPFAFATKFDQRDLRGDPFESQGYLDPTGDPDVPPSRGEQTGPKKM